MLALVAHSQHCLIMPCRYINRHDALDRVGCLLLPDEAFLDKNLNCSLAYNTDLQNDIECRHKSLVQHVTITSEVDPGNILAFRQNFEKDSIESIKIPVVYLPALNESSKSWVWIVKALYLLSILSGVSIYYLEQLRYSTNIICGMFLHTLRHSEPWRTHQRIYSID